MGSSVSVLRLITRKTGYNKHTYIYRPLYTSFYYIQKQTNINPTSTTRHRAIKSSVMCSSKINTDYFVGEALNLAESAECKQAMDELTACLPEARLPQTTVKKWYAKKFIEHIRQRNSLQAQIAAQRREIERLKPQVSTGPDKWAAMMAEERRRATEVKARRSETKHVKSVFPPVRITSTGSTGSINLAAMRAEEEGRRVIEEPSLLGHSSVKPRRSEAIYPKSDLASLTSKPTCSKYLGRCNRTIFR